MLNTANSLAHGSMQAGLTPTHWVIIAILVLVLFGGKKLPELARGLAKGLRIFKEELHGVKKELDSTDETTPLQKPDQTAKTDPTKSDQTDPKDKLG